MASVRDRISQLETQVRRSKRLAAGGDSASEPQETMDPPFEAVGPPAVDAESLQLVGEDAVVSTSVGDVEGFALKVTRMCDLEDKMKVMNAEVKTVRDEKNALREELIQYMKERGVGHCNLNKRGEVLYLEERESAGALNRRTLLNALKDFYEVSGVYGGDSAETDEALHEVQACFNHINEFLGTQSRTVLIREKRNKKKRVRKTPKYSVFEEPKRPRVKQTKIEEVD